MAKVIGGIERLTERMKVAEAAEVELAAAGAQVEAAEVALAEADRELAASSACAVAGGWPERRGLKRCEADREEVRRSLERAKEAAAAKRKIVEGLRDELAELKSATSDRLVKAAIAKAEELMATLRRQQDALLSTAKRAVALHAAVAAFTPKRIVSQRIPKKYLRVVSDDPAIQGLYKSSKPVGSFSLEPLKALAGARAGKWTIIPGQDLVFSASEIETTYGDGALPKEVEAMQDLRLGIPIGSEGEDSRRELDFCRLLSLLSEAEVLSMTRELEG